MFERRYLRVGAEEWVTPIRKERLITNKAHEGVTDEEVGHPDVVVYEVSYEEKCCQVFFASVHKVVTHD